MRLLYLTVDFSPKGSSAAVRHVNFVKYLVRQGHAVQVVTYDEQALTLFSPADVDLGTKVPPEVGIARVSPGPLRRWLMWRLARRGQSADGYTERLKVNFLVWLLVPDPQVDAVPAFVQEGRRQILRFKPNVLLTAGYPFSMQIAGAYLKRRYPEVCWVADYGDPWSGNPVSELRPPAWREKMDYHLERFLLRWADQVTVTTEGARALYLRLFPFLDSKISVLPMGFDPEDFECIKERPRMLDEREQLWLVHTGRVYSDARDPVPFVNALSRLVQQDSTVLAKLRVYLVGEVEKCLKDRMLASPARNLFLFVPWVPVYESISWMKAADYLLLFGNKGGVQVPGKVYQYLGSGRPIFMTSLCDADTTTQLVLNAPESVVVPNDEERILDALRALVFRKQKTSACFGVEADSPYAWPQIVRKLTKAVETLAHA